MSTTFTPPRPDQWEGPSAGAAFTPPPVSSWQGPAAQSADGGFLHEAFVNPAKQVASGAVGLVGYGNKLAANTFDLLDKAAEHISKATGTEKGGVFQALANYTRAQQAISEKKAQELSGGRQDFVSQLYRQGTEAIGQIPAYAVAGHILGPTAGIAALSGLSAADQGPVEAAKAAAEGALTGGAMKVLGPGSRLLRATALGGATAAKAGLQGADPATALSQGITMGGMAALPPGGKTLKEAVRDEALYRGGQAVSKIATQVGGGNLNPVERAAVEEQLSRGVPVRFGTQTGNRAIQALEESTANTPLGAQRAAIFNRGTLEGLQGWAGSQAQELHPEAVTPESVGRAVPAKLDQIIAQEGVKRNAAYDRAWVGRDNPEFDEEVPVGYRRGQPVLNEEGQETGFHEQEPVFERVNMPVDISNLKMMAKPIYDQMNLRMAPAAQHASAGFHALEVLLKSPDYVPAWQAEDALGALKSMARLETGEGVRDVSQGIAAHLIPTMQEGIEAAVAKTGDDALAGLREARKIHAGIMDVDEIARKMRDKEPVGNFARLTRPKDTGIDYLHNVQNLAPEQMPAVGRAYFDDLITRVFREGDIRKTLGILNEWRDLGTENKKVLFPNESWRASADNLIKSLDMSAKILNTSGTELMRGAKSRNPFDWLQGYIGGKLFYTPEGINLLANAIKPQSPGSQALNMAKVKAAAGREGPPEEPPQGPPEEPPTGGGGEGGPGAPPPPPPPPGAPPGSGGGAAALQGGLERNQERIAANRETLTGRPDVESKPVQQQPGSTESVTPALDALSKKYSIDNPQNEYQYTTPEGIPVYKSPEGESTPPGGSPDMRLGPGDFLTEKPALHPAPQATPPGSSPGEPAIPPGTTGRAALQGGLERNQAAIEANKEKLTGQDPASWRGKLEQAAADSQQRIDQFWKDQGSQANVGIPAHVLADYAVIGAHHIVKGADTFGAWSQRMLETAGEQIRPHLRAVWAQSKHIAGQVGWGESGTEEMPLGKRLTVPGTKVPPTSPPIAQSPAPHLVGRAIENLDTWHKNNPQPFASPENYIKGMSELFQPKNGRVPIPPENLLAYVSDPEAIGRSIDEVSPDQRKLTDDGLRAGLTARQLYRDGKATPTHTGMYFVWGGLSPRQSPYPQEAAFLRALDRGMEGWVDKSAAGKFTEEDLPAYMKWADATLKGTPGAQATSNLHNVGSQFLINAAKPVTHGPYKGMLTMQALHDIMADESLSTAEARRRFQQIGKGLGVDNKVFSFVRLVTGHHDTLVADRVRINDFWDAPGLKEKGLAYNTDEQGVVQPTANLYDSGLAEPWSGIPGLGMYEGAENALTEPIRKAYADRGIKDGTLGRWHWETWLAKSAQEVSHGSLNAIQKMAGGRSGPEAVQGEGVRQGKYNDLSYGTRYERAPEGYRFIWEKSGGKTAALNPERHQELLKTLRSQRDRAKIDPGAERVISYGTKTSEATTAPWRNLPGVNQSALDRLIDQLSAYRSK